MNIVALPKDGIEFDPEGYLEYRARSVIRDMIRAQQSKRRAEALLMSLFEEEAGRII